MVVWTLCIAFKCLWSMTFGSWFRSPLRLEEAKVLTKNLIVSDIRINFDTSCHSWTLTGVWISLFQGQFCVAFLHSFQLLFHDCGYPQWSIYFILPNAIFFYYLFNNFYCKAYDINKKKEVKLSWSVLSFFRDWQSHCEVQTGLAAVPHPH